MSSKLTRLSQPWRSAVPMQSVPVSPPPMTTTFLPLALSSLPSVRFESSRLLVLALRNSMAKCTPSPSRPSTGRSRGRVAPTASTSASCDACSASSAYRSSPPTLALVTKRTPSSAMRSTRRWTTFTLSALGLGTPYIMRPPTRSSRSYTVTMWPARLSSSAAASPAGPEPMMPTLRPDRTSGGRGTIQPFSKPMSMMVHSMDLMDTGSSMMPSVHAPSHGAGHTRPVNSGKLLVSSRRSSASRQRPWCTSAFHSGILLPSGQPLFSGWCVSALASECDVLWQYGVPQSMQRAACECSCEWSSSPASGSELEALEAVRTTSSQSLRRSVASRYGSPLRAISRKPRRLSAVPTGTTSGRGCCSRDRRAASLISCSLP
mmetsp:Transcript_10767/g.44541  ORF Transcript_10767/g.44541 Transcript_10767/m.44541 type:complete len:376 (-) Transcript_10767:1627-2754(-)